MPLAAYLAWERRERLLSIPLQPSLLGLPIVLGSLGVLAIGTLGAELFLTRVSIIGVLGGFVVGVFKLDFNDATYLRNTLDFLQFQDVASGLVKAAVFGFLRRSKDQFR